MVPNLEKAMSDRKHVMILEDNELNCKLFKDIIGAVFDEPKISVCVDKLDGIAMAYETKVDFFLTDLLSNVFGTHFLRWVKSDPRFDNIPVVICSAIGSTKSWQLSLIAAGADDATFKSIDVEKFIDVIR